MFPCISSPRRPEPDPSADISTRRVQLLTQRRLQVRCVCVCVAQRFTDMWTDLFAAGTTLIFCGTSLASHSFIRCDPLLRQQQDPGQASADTADWPAVNCQKMGMSVFKSIIREQRLPGNTSCGVLQGELGLIRKGNNRNFCLAFLYAGVHKCLAP